MIYDAAIRTVCISENRKAMHPKVTYYSETERNQQINYLNLSPRRKYNKIILGIYRKRTYKDTVMPNSSNYPGNHKIAAFNYLLTQITKFTYYGRRKN